MANRSYLYAVDREPGTPGEQPRITALSEWNREVPIVHRVLLTGSPRLCPSTIWGPPVPAIVGDYDTGVANLERYLAALPQTDEVRAHAAAALAALKDPARRSRFLLLEPAEIVASTIIDDDDDDGQALAAGVEVELYEVSTIDTWLRNAPDTAPMQLDEATGAGHWPQVLYYEPASRPDPPAEAAPSAPEPPVSAPAAAPPPPTSQPSYQPQPQHQPQPPHQGQPPSYGAPAPYVMPPAPYGVQPTGSIAWGMGLLVLVPFPIVSTLLAGVLMIVLGRSQRKNGPLAAANGIRAANWGVTFLVVSVLLWVAHFAVLAAVGSSTSFYPVGIPITILGVFTIAHIVVCALGLTKAKKGQVLNVPVIPAIR